MFCMDSHRSEEISAEVFRGLRRAATLVSLALMVLGIAVPAAAQSPSNASNYGHGAQLSVNSRTGDVTVAAALLRLPGIVSELGVGVTLTYRSSDAIANQQSGTRFFGLPLGWSLGISFIYADSTSTKLNVDGSQSYQLSEDWRTSFTPTGGSSRPVKTGLLQYNRADANLRSDGGTVTVGNITSGYVFTTLEGLVKYFSGAGLLLREVDRFGNHIDYRYRSSITGHNANEDTTPEDAEFLAIVDTWDNEITFANCEDAGCEPGQVTITLPDGRTVGWVADDDYTISQLIDTEGMVTHLSWESSPCEQGHSVLTSMTLPVGGMTALEYDTCLEVCTEPSSISCSQTTTRPVVSALYECPDNASGAACPAGSAGNDYLTTQYQYGTASNDKNYTGFPNYSPSQPSDPLADALMSSNDTGFVYTTVVSKHRTNGTIIHQVETDYNFLHLQTEQRVSVRARQADGKFGLSLSKETSHCYSVSEEDGGPSCPLDSGDYQDLPTNYQSPTIIGTCSYNVGENADPSLGRRSVVTLAYDGFGKQVRKRKYHGNSTNGIVSDCDRSARLSTNEMQLVTEDHMQHDTPTTVTSDDFVEIGAGSGHFGLTLGHQSFVYLDEDNSGVGAHPLLADTGGPILVKLQCNTLTTDSGVEKAGTAAKTSTTGLMPTSAVPPATLGIIDACASSSWVSTVAPPKTTSYTYDGNGRSLTQVTAWAEGFTAPGGVGSTSQMHAYGLTDSNDGEESCGDGKVLKLTSTDGQGNTTVNRLCTQNGFHLSAADGHGNTTLMEHSANGVTTKTTHANGTFVTSEHYHACPVAQDGRTRTCPNTSTALKNCPYGSQGPTRNCVVRTMHAGSGGTGNANESFVDGVLHVTVKDGLGRIVELLDNLGGSSGAGFTALQTSKTMVYDDRGMMSSTSEHFGASDPIVYATATVLDEKMRPSLACGPRGVTHEFFHDDVEHKTKAIFNGSDREAYVLNDSEKLTTIANCDLTAGQTTSGGSCPAAAAQVQRTFASDKSSPECAGDSYMTYTLHDGAGQEHSVSATAGDTVDLGASVTSVNGVTTYSADTLKYAYNYASSSGTGGAVTASSWFSRELQGHVVEQSVAVTADNPAGTPASASPSPTPVTHTFTSDSFEFNNIDQKIAETNKLATADGTPLEETYTYTQSGKLETMTTYEGVTFENYYDNRNRLVRHCFPTAQGVEGEKMELDPLTGAILKVTHFTNPGACSESDAGDTDVVWETYKYTRFGGIESIAYSDGTTLEWAYDQYQRKTCFADALATQNGSEGCPESPTATEFSPAADQLLVSYSYWPNGDSYRRGLKKSQCRGVPDGSGGFVTKCIDTDYYTPIESGGTCADDLSGIVGAYAGMVKTESYCTGGSCDDSGTLVYKTTYSYDEHRRPCNIESRNADGDVILSSVYGYDQFDNVVHEEHTSGLDPSTDSNYELDNVYDGMVRLVTQTRNDSNGVLIERTTFKYDAVSNIVQKIQEVTVPDVEGTPTHTPGVTETEPPQPLPTSTSPPAPTSTSPPAAEDDDGCQIHTGGSSPWQLLLPLALVVLLRRRGRRGVSAN